MASTASTDDVMPVAVALSVVRKNLLESCQQLDSIIRSAFPEDSCVCYPNFVSEGDLETLLVGRYKIQLAESLHVEFLRHVLRLVRPGAVEHEREAPNSRFVRPTSASKILIPMIRDASSGEVNCLGFNECSSWLQQQESPTQQHQLVEVVIDYEPSFAVPPTCNQRAPFRALSRFGLEEPKFSVMLSIASEPAPPAAQPSSPTSSSFTSDDSSQVSNSQTTSALLKKILSNSSPLSSTLKVTPKRCFSGHYSLKGKRSLQEDRIIVIPDLRAPSPSNDPQDKISFNAVYDGHGGSSVADFVSSRFHLCLMQRPQFPDDIEEALRETFQCIEDAVVKRSIQLARLEALHDYVVKTYRVAVPLPSLTAEKLSLEIPLAWDTDEICDELTLQLKQIQLALETLQKRLGIDVFAIPEKAFLSELNDSLSGGTTALIAVVHGHTAYVANLGDSRCILMRGESATCLTEDHRLRSNAREIARIRSIPGTFSCDDYLCGVLGVSRAFGNVSILRGEKLLGLSCCPDVLRFDLRTDDQFMVIACDGVFDIVAATDVAFTTRMYLEKTGDPNLAAQKLAELSLVNQADDNISAIVIKLDNLFEPKLGSQESLSHIQVPTHLVLVDAPLKRQLHKCHTAQESLAQQFYDGLSPQPSSLASTRSLDQTDEDCETQLPNPAGCRRRYCWSVIQTPTEPP